MRPPQAQLVPIGTIHPRPGNPRKHNLRQRRKIAASIRRFGFINPIIVDGDGRIIAGAGRYGAAQDLGLEAVPVILVDHLPPEEVRAYVLADNRLAELAEWDEDLLRIELTALIEVDFDLELTGFDMAEIDLLLDEAPASAADVVPPVSDNPPVSQPGDLWCLGAHRLLCGDARSEADWKRLMEDRRAQVVFTDPPYNVAIDGHVCGSGSVRHDEFVMASGEMTEAEFTDFLCQVLTRIASFSGDGTLIYACMDWRHLYELQTAGRQAGLELKNLCVWAKTNGGMGSFYRSQHELVCVFKHGRGRHINNVELGRHGRNRSNLWTYAGISSISPDRATELAMHPTVKPVALVADAILDASRRKGIVVDPFCGSGTTLVAAERTGRVCHAMELDPRYVDTIIRRWEAWTGDQAIHAVTGATFGEINDRLLENPLEAGVAQ